MISKKKWIKWLKDELLFECPEKYYILKYLPQMAAKRAYGVITPKEIIESIWPELYKFGRGID